MSTYETSSLALEGLVVIILIAEFVYDALWNNREAQLKRRRNEKAKKSPEMDKQRFREGKGGVFQETKREVCDLPKAPSDVQTEIKP